MWKGEIMVADIEDLGNLVAPEIHGRRLKAKEVSTSHKGVNILYSQLQMAQQNCQEETTNSEKPL